MVLQGARHDLGGRGGAAVDQHHHRLAAGQVAGLGLVAIHVLRVAAAGGDDLARFEEGVGDRHRLVEQPARIVAQVEHIALHVVRAAHLLLHLQDALLQVLEGLLGELGHAQHAHIALDPALGRGDLDVGAGDHDVEGLVGAFAHDGDGDVRADRPAHLVHRVREGQAQHALAVDMGDEVVGLDPGLGRGGVVDRRHHLDEAVLHGDLDPEAPELALGLHLHVVEGAGGQIGRMRVQGREHAVDGALDQGLLVRLLHIRGAHALEDVAEQVEIFVGGAGVAFLGAQRDGERSGDDRSGERAPEGCDDEFLHGVPALPWGSANQLAGGTGAPSSRTST